MHWVIRLYHYGVLTATITSFFFNMYKSDGPDSYDSLALFRLGVEVLRQVRWDIATKDEGSPSAQSG